MITRSGSVGNVAEQIMPLMDFPQASLFDPQRIAPGILEAGSLPHLLRQLGADLVPGFLKAEWRGAGRRGRPAWPASKLLALELLRWHEHGMGRANTCRRAKTDLAWRAALWLPAYGSTPTEKTLREFETWLTKRTPTCDRPRYEVLFEGLALRARGVLQDPVWVMDGTPMYCFGALLGTVRLLGDGLRGLLRRWGRFRRQRLVEVARRLDVVWVTAKSIKGGLAADWSNPEERRQALKRLVEDVVRVVEHIEQHICEVAPSRHEGLRERLGTLLHVIEKDIGVDDDGNFFVVRKAGGDRTVSVTEPEARSGHKSKQSKFKGFKLVLLGDLVSGFIAGVKVFKGNEAEGRHGVDVLERAKRLQLTLERALGDSAYGGTPTRLAARRMGIELVAPPPSLQIRNNAPLQKHEFDVDFEKQTATCPAGVQTANHRLGPFEGALRSVYEWPHEACLACELRQSCVPKMRTDPTPRRGQQPKGRRLKLDVNEQALRQARAEWPSRREEYRRRGQGERLVARLIRFGGRQARAFGLQAANLQVHLIAITNNLTLLAAQDGRATAQASLPLWSA